MEFGKKLSVTKTPIPGMLLFDLPVHGDSRGWFKENWQREKMLGLGLPDFNPVQNNISFNDKAGTTRGMHAEPWDKFVSVATGRIFGAWVDLREGPSFGTVFTVEMDAGKAIFIPRGVANSYQTLEDNTSYVYLVNEHWSPDADYTFLNLADESVNIEWPIPLDHAEVSEKDKTHPRLASVMPMAAKKTLVLGADGQLGRALRAAYSGNSSVEFADRQHFNLLDPQSYRSRVWQKYSTIINAAAYTAVDAAESDAGRQAAWALNVTAVADLAKIAIAKGIVFVQVSSDYVFDGSRLSYDESEGPAPLGVYAQTKAAADAVVSVVPRHYIIRTSWVIGDGANFVRTMASLAEKGTTPTVVNDQIGRLTFAGDLAAGIKHLLDTQAPYGTYNLTNDGDPQSWADVARDVFELVGANREDVTGVSTEQYFKERQGAPRPSNGVLSLDKIRGTGFVPPMASERLREYVRLLG